MKESSQTEKRGIQGDRILMIFLAVILISTSIWTSIQFLQPSGVRENIDAMVQDCLGIISAAQKWQRSSKVVGGAERQGWSELSFDKLGYVDGVDTDLRVLTNSNARYTIRISQKGASFDLIAESRQGKMIIYRGVNSGIPPDPEIR